MNKKTFEAIYKLVKDKNYVIITDIPTSEFMTETSDLSERFSSKDINRVALFDDFVYIALAKKRIIYIPYNHIITILSN